MTLEVAHSLPPLAIVTKAALHITMILTFLRLQTERVWKVCLSMALQVYKVPTFKTLYA